MSYLFTTLEIMYIYRHLFQTLLTESLTLAFTYLQSETYLFTKRKLCQAFYHKLDFWNRKSPMPYRPVYFKTSWFGLFPISPSLSQPQTPFSTAVWLCKTLRPLTPYLWSVKTSHNIISTCGSYFATATNCVITIMTSYNVSINSN